MNAVNFLVPLIFFVLYLAAVIYCLFRLFHWIFEREQHDFDKGGDE